MGLEHLNPPDNTDAAEAPPSAVAPEGRFDVSASSIKEFLMMRTPETREPTIEVAAANITGADGRIDFAAFADLYKTVSNRKAETRTQTGDQLAPASDATPEKRLSQTPAAAARDALLESARRKFQNPLERTRFRADVDEFSKRAGTDGLDQNEVRETYENVNRLLTVKHSAVPLTRMTQLAREVMAQAARPQCIDQGGNNSCAVTTVENIIYTTQPGVASKLVADVATTGSYTAQDGTTVTLDRKTLQPDAEAQKSPRVDGQRSFATQLFNAVGFNLHYKHSNPLLRYEVHPPTKRSEGGERIIDLSKDPPERMKNKCGKFDEPGLYENEIIKVYQIITGRDGKDLVLSHQDGIVKLADEATSFNSVADFGTKLQDLKNRGKLPAILSVNTAIEPFYSDAGGGSPNGYEGGHVLVVRDYLPGPPPRVAVDNQYGTVQDRLGSRMMSLRDLYLTTLPTASAVKHLEAEIKADKAKKINDPKKVRELERLRKHTPPKDCEWY